jgi:DNA-binding NtrC family response regulator
MIRARVLVVDDKENILNLLRKVLGDHCDVTTAEDGARALALAAQADFDVIVTDIRMPGADGFEVLREAKRLQPDVEVILMTAYGSVQKAVEAMKDGAYDYLTKPFDPDEALLIVQKAAERKHLREQARDLRRALEGAFRFEKLVGNSASIRRVFELMHRGAASDATVLITGESGTGKELVAQAIHYASARKDAPFVAINCGAIPETLIESELFGHVRGAFTGAVAARRGLFEAAHPGTLFLDEVGDLPLAMQVKLTRALQEHTIRRVGDSTERKVDVRVIAATNVDLERAVTEGKFREDLFYRLNIFPVHLPPLRERKEDIPLLAAHFVTVHGKKYRSRVEGFEPEALSALVRHSWPGNIRELENAIERALAVVDGPRIPIEALPDEVASLGRGKRNSRALARLTFREAVETARDRTAREYLIALMGEFGGNVTHAAERAGIERESLHRLLKRCGIRSEEFRNGD